MPYIETNGADTFYLDEGEGQPLVFIPGMMRDHRTWNHQAEALSERYRVIRYDVRGRGLTGPTDAEEYTFELYANDLHELRSELGLDDPVVCGHSYGSHIAFSYASRFQTAGLVAISGGPPNVGMDLSERQGKIFQKMTELLKLLTDEAGYYEAEAALNDVMDTALDGLNEDPEAIEGVLNTGDVPGMTGEEILKVSAVGNDDGFDISRIDVPVLGLFGEIEHEYFQSHINEMEANLKNIEIRIVPRAGHDLPTARPEFVADELDSFIKQKISSVTD